MWNASSDLLSATVRVQVSDAYRSTDCTKANSAIMIFSQMIIIIILIAPVLFAVAWHNAEQHRMAANLCNRMIGLSHRCA